MATNSPLQQADYSWAQNFGVQYAWWPAQPFVSWLVVLLLILILLYIARLEVHKVIAALFGGMQRMLRLMVKFLHGVNGRLQQRNRDVLLARGRERYEHLLEKDFIRVAAQVSTDMSAWPSIHREMREHITRMDDEYIKSIEVPPQPADWLPVIKSVASLSTKISTQGVSVIASILQDIHLTLKKAMEKSVEDYQQASRNRHALLKKMAPQWRELKHGLDSLETKIIRLDQRAHLVDAHIETYQQIIQGTDQAVRVLKKSAAGSLLLTTCLLLIAAAGGVVNFQLLALPLAEVVGVHGDILGVRSSDVAAAIVIFMQIVVGLFLLEAAGVTLLLPEIAMLERRKRRSVMYLMLVLLLAMAGMESMLVYTRDALAVDYAALDKLLLASPAMQAVSLSWIPAVGQVVLGFILPLLLIFSVIAFESFIYALRTVAGMFLSWLLEVFSMLFRLLASGAHILSNVLIAVYDFIIFLPLYIERVVQHRRARQTVEIKSVTAETDA